MLRPFLVRLLIAGFVMILVCLAGYVGLGWAIWKRQSWTYNHLSENVRFRLHDAYCAAFETISPGDQDSDGLTDGWEIFAGINPRDPKDHSEMDGRWDTDGFVVHVQESLGDGVPSFDNMDRDLWPKSGEPLPMRGHVMISSFASTFARGFRLRITPTAGYLLAAPAGTPSASPLVVPVARDGAIGFDLYASEGVVNDQKVPARLQFHNAATGEPLNAYSDCSIKRRWDLDSIAPTVDTEEKINEWSQNIGLVYHLSWRDGPPSTEKILVEAARNLEAAPWQPIALFGPEMRGCTVYQYRRWPSEKVLKIHGLVVPYDGPLKFRVVPVRFSHVDGS